MIQINREAEKALIELVGFGGVEEANGSTKPGEARGQVQRPRADRSRQGGRHRQACWEGMKREDIAKRLGVGVASDYRVLASARTTRPPASSPDALSQALAANPCFKVLPRSGAGFIIDGQR